MNRNPWTSGPNDPETPEPGAIDPATRPLDPAELHQDPDAATDADPVDPEGADPTPTEPVATRPRRRPSRAVWIASAVAVTALLSGVVVGGAITDPTTSEAYQSLTRDKQAVEGERDQLRTDYAAEQEKYTAERDKYLVLENGISGRETDVAARETAVAKAEGAVKDAEAAVKKREAAVTKTEQTKAANTVSDGTWTVGTDLAPGTYRTTAAVDSTCYWGIYASGSNGGDIIENDLPGGGRPVVTLAAGQDFSTQRCGSWEKQ